MVHDRRQWPSGVSNRRQFERRRPARSFAIHIRFVGYAESEVVLEADIFDDDNSPYTPLQTVAYAYDVFNRLTRRTHDPDADGEEAATEEFFSWEAGQIVLQFAGDEAADLAHRNLFNPAAVDHLFAVENVDSLTAPGEVLYPLTDHLNTVRAVARHNATTHVTTLADTRRYSSFGVLLSDFGPANTIAFGFTGVYSDPVTGYNNHRERWTDPATGEWLSEDPSGLAPDSNPYRYVSNAPMMWSDPSGLDKRVVGGYTVEGTGHHIIPVELWEEFRFDPQTYKFLDDIGASKRIPTIT